MLNIFRELRTGILLAGGVLGVLAALHLWAPEGWAETYLTGVSVTLFATQIVVFVGIAVLVGFDGEDHT